MNRTTRERPWRRDPESIRADVLAAAIEILSEDGLGTGVERITLDRAVQRAGVPRASAYRLWSGGPIPPQQAFQGELLRSLAAQDARGDRDLGTTVAAANRVLEATPPLADLSPEQRWQVLREMIRIAATTNLDAVVVSPLWQAWIGVMFAASSRDLSADEELHRAIRHGEERSTTRYVGIYESLAAAFGLRLRAPYTYRHFATAAASMVEGLAIRDELNPHVRDLRRKTAPDGGEQDWSLFAVAIEALVRQCFETDPTSPTPTAIADPSD